MPYKGSASALARHGVVQSATRLAAEGRAIRGLAAMNGRSSQMRKPCPTVWPKAAKQAPARTAAGSAFRLAVSGRGTVGDLLRPGSSGDSAAPSRSRRTRLSPSCALGHRAGPYRVYDAAFYTRYQDALNNPVRWQAEADQRGIQTVILLHWWPIRLCRFLLADRRWALVYFDETVFVFLRREGNEALISAPGRCEAPYRPPGRRRRAPNREAHNPEAGRGRGRTARGKRMACAPFSSDGLRPMRSSQACARTGVADDSTPATCYGCPIGVGAVKAARRSRVCLAPQDCRRVRRAPGRASVVAESAVGGPRRKARLAPAVAVVAIAVTAVFLRVRHLAWGLADDQFFPDEIIWITRARAFVPRSRQSFRVVEEVVAHGEHVGRAPRLLRERREAVVAEEERQRGPALRQVAVLGLEPEVARQPVAVARGEVRELVERGRLPADAAHRHRPPEEDEGDGRAPAGREPRGRGSTVDPHAAGIVADRAGPQSTRPRSVRSRGLAGSGGSLHSRQAPAVAGVYGLSCAVPGSATAPGAGRSPAESTVGLKVGGMQKRLTRVEACPSPLVRSPAGAAVSVSVLTPPPAGPKAPASRCSQSGQAPWPFCGDEAFPSVQPKEVTPAILQTAYGFVSHVPAPAAVQHCQGVWSAVHPLLLISQMPVPAPVQHL